MTMVCIYVYISVYVFNQFTASISGAHSAHRMDLKQQEKISKRS